MNTPLVDPKTFEMAKDAYNSGELTFTRSNSYPKPHGKKTITLFPKLGHIYYLIYWETANKIVYAGAYEINIEYENKLLADDKLVPFLCHQLCTQLV